MQLTKLCVVLVSVLLLVRGDVSSIVVPSWAVVGADNGGAFGGINPLPTLSALSGDGGTLYIAGTFDMPTYALRGVTLTNHGYQTADVFVFALDTHTGQPVRPYGAYVLGGYGGDSVAAMASTGDGDLLVM